MEKFNNTTIFTGYLKQLLHDFNLPKYRVYTKENQKYFEKNGKESLEIVDSKNSTKGILYIKDGEIQEYLNGEWINAGQRDTVKPKTVFYYNYNQKILNYTKNLIIKNNSYDAYTHEYLGEYLRFQRDYNDIDLMPLYNCFSDNQCDNLKLSGNILIPTENKTGFTRGKKVSFDTTDQNYKIYMVPVKLFKEYTIAIDSASPIEICCGVYSDKQDIVDRYSSVYMMTYQYFSNFYFGQPQLYSKILNLPQSSIDDIITHEQDFKLFLKVPVYNESSIVILEGDYTDYTNPFSVKYDSLGIFSNKVQLNDELLAIKNMTLANEGADYYKYEIDEVSGKPVFVINTDELHEDTQYQRAQVNNSGILSFTDTSAQQTYLLSYIKGIKPIANHTIINFEGNFQEITKLITPLQLLRLNTTESYPFADRLVEYLIGNAITSSEDQAAHNVARVQKAIEFNTISAQNYSKYDDKGKPTPDSKPIYTYRYKTKNKDIWDNNIKYIIYDYMSTNYNSDEVNHDILGFIDKDAEKYYDYPEDPNGNLKQRNNISNTILDEDDQY